MKNAKVEIPAVQLKIIRAGTKEVRQPMKLCRYMTGGGGWGGILHLDLKRIRSENGVESEDIVTMPFFFWLLGKLTIRMKHVFIALLNNREKEGHSALQLVLGCQIFLIN